MNKAVNIALIIICVLIGAFTILELGLRLFYGFGAPLLYLTDPQIGYLLAPNQQTRRFGNAISINQYSMRSPEISAARPETTWRVLMLGDSIINGGWWTDQANTISALLQQQLYSSHRPQTGGFQTEGFQVEVLNASANSWAPRNQLAYLRQFGTFQAQTIVLVINTDDLFGTAPSSVVVGRDRNYPAAKPPLALVEVWQRYVVKAPVIPELEAIQAEGGDRVAANLAAIEQIRQIAMQDNAQFVLVITPLLRELGEPGPRDYELKARQRLEDFVQEKQIAWIDFLPIFNRLPDPQTLYHDSIHLNLAGNQKVVRAIADALKERI